VNTNQQVVQLAVGIVREHIDSLDRQADIAQGLDKDVYSDIRENEIELRKAVQTIEKHIKNL